MSCVLCVYVMCVCHVCHVCYECYVCDAHACKNVRMLLDWVQASGHLASWVKLLVEPSSASLRSFRLPMASNRRGRAAFPPIARGTSGVAPVGSGGGTAAEATSHEPAGLLSIAGDTREAVPAGSGGGTAAEATSHEPAASAPDAKTDAAGPVVTPAPPRQPALSSGATQPAPGSASAEESSWEYIALSIGYESEKYEQLKTIFPNFEEIVVNVAEMIRAPPRDQRTRAGFPDPQITNQVKFSRGFSRAVKRCEAMLRNKGIVVVACKWTSQSAYSGVAS